MKKWLSIEYVLLCVLWALSICTYSIALLNNYVLYTTDYLGLFALTVCSIICWRFQEKRFLALFTLLAIGTFNLWSFAYFINIITTFSFGFINTPDISLISFSCLLILIFSRQKMTLKLLSTLKHGSKDSQEARKQGLEEKFYAQFNSLTIQELKRKKELPLVPEATIALNRLIVEKSREQPQSVTGVRP